MNELPGLIILGFGGHARSVADVALSLGIKRLHFFDENARPGENFLGHPVTSTLDFSLLGMWAVFPASGDNLKRATQVKWAKENNLPLFTLVSERATIGLGASVGEGSFVGHHAHLGPMSAVGVGCIINTGAVVEHECLIDEFTHVSVNTVIAGRSTVGRRCFIGAGATVIDGISVADDITVGAGGCVLRSLSDAGIYVGVPARRVGEPD
jgi:UDP-N-acetylbacillosamine N-acetyltransferase